jgi:hypothetical protein
LGIEFGQKNYVAIVTTDVEDEVHRSGKLSFKFPWFDEADFAEERRKNQLRLSKAERERVEASERFIREWALSETPFFIREGRTPPSPTDCHLLAIAQERNLVVVTDDEGMHLTANSFDIEIWRGHELLNRMKAAKLIDATFIRELYLALETNGDMTAAWTEAKHTVFKKVFGADHGDD